MPIDWTLDELGHAGPEHLDASYVETYNAKAQFDPTEDIALLQGLGLSQDSVVMDVGTGTGIFATAVAPHCQEIIAVDPSPAMVASLQRTVAESEIPNLSIVHSGILTYQHDDAPVDIIYTRHALHHLPDFWKTMALKKMRDLLVRGGILLVKDLFFDFSPAEAEVKLQKWIDSAAADPAVGWTAAELAEHLREEHSTYCWLFDEMLRHTGFEIVEQSSRFNLFATYICRAV